MTMIKRQRLETEILKQLNDGKIDKVQETVKQFSQKFGPTDIAVRLLESEAELERLISAKENIDLPTSTALSAVESRLQTLQSVDNNKDSLFRVKEESTILLSKLAYAVGKPRKCLKLFDQINLDGLHKDLHKKFFRDVLLAEAFAIKGFCLEQRSSSHDDKQSADPMLCYENSVVTFLGYITQSEKQAQAAIQKGSSDSVSISPHITKCLSHLPVMKLKKGQVENTVALLRLILRALNAQGASDIRQTTSYKLAAVLSRGVSQSNYKPEYDVPKKLQDLRKTLSTNKHSLLPKNLEQEKILLLQIAESLLNVDPVLDMSIEHSDSRNSTLRNADCLYNLIVIALLPQGLKQLVSSSFTRSLKYAFDHLHTWKQYGLCLSLSRRKENVAIKAFAECCRIENNTTYALMGAKTCFQLDPPDIDQGLLFADLAVQALDANNGYDPDNMMSRIYLYTGIGMSLKSQLSVSKPEKKNWHQGALEAFAKSHDSDPFDSKALLGLALELAYERRISEAVAKVKLSLLLDPECLQSLHLLTLLLTARKQYQEAKSTLLLTLDMYPSCPILLATKCKLELAMGEQDSALHSCHEFMKLQNTLQQEKPSSIVSPPPGNDLAETELYYSANPSLGTDLDNGLRMRTGSIATGMSHRVRLDISEADSSIIDIQPRTAMQCSDYVDAWIQVADVYLACNRPTEAENCVNEAASVNPLAPSVFIIRGLLFENEGQYADACAMYNIALAADPTNVRATERLAAAHSRQGNTAIVEQLLRNAVNLDMKSHVIWSDLAEVLERNGDRLKSAECMTLALSLEQTCPVVPFTVVQLEL